MSLIKSIRGKKVNFDFNKDFISIFSDKIKASDIKFINQTLKDLHPSDVANLIENLSSDSRAKLIEIEAFNIDPEIFIEINESIQSEVLQLLSTDSIAKILRRLESDNAIAILENLETNNSYAEHVFTKFINCAIGNTYLSVNINNSRAIHFYKKMQMVNLGYYISKIDNKKRIIFMYKKNIELFRS